MHVRRVMSSEAHQSSGMSCLSPSCTLPVSFLYHACVLHVSFMNPACIFPVSCCNSARIMTVYFPYPASANR